MAATMHAEAVLHSTSATLAGVGGRDGTGDALAAAAGAPRLGLDALIEASDALVLATAEDAVPMLLSSIGDRVSALLIEAPLPRDLPAPDVPAMTGANLLHAPAVRQSTLR